MAADELAVFREDGVALDEVGALFFFVCLRGKEKRRGQLCFLARGRGRRALESVWLAQLICPKAFGLAKSTVPLVVLPPAIRAPKFHLFRADVKDVSHNVD